MAKYILGRSLRKNAEAAQWLQRFLWAVDFLLVGALLLLFRLLPIDTASATGAWLGRVIGPRLEKNRHLRHNFELAFPQKPAAAIDQLVSDAWANGGAVLAEYPHLNRIANSPDRLHVQCADTIQVFDNPARPAIFVTMHQANWELTAATVAKLGVPLSCLYTPPSNPWLAEKLVRERAAMGVELLPRDANIRRLIEALENGRSLGIVMDRRVDSGEPVPFFGMPKQTTLLPARLAIKYGYELIPTQIERLADSHFLTTFHTPIKAEREAGSELDQAIEMTQRINVMFEEWVRLAPDEWLCSKRLWSKGQQPASNSLSTPLEA